MIVSALSLAFPIRQPAIPSYSQQNNAKSGACFRCSSSEPGAGEEQSGMSERKRASLWQQGDGSQGLSTTPSVSGQLSLGTGRRLAPEPLWTPKAMAAQAPSMNNVGFACNLCWHMRYSRMHLHVTSTAWGQSSKFSFGFSFGTFWDFSPQISLI